MITSFFMCLLIKRVLFSEIKEQEKDLLFDVDFFMKGEKIFSWDKTTKLYIIKQCIPELVSKVSLTNKESKGFDILLLFIIKLKNEVSLQNNYLLKNVLPIKKSLNQVYYEHLNEKLDKEIVNQIYQNLLYPVYNKDLLFEDNDFSLYYPEFKKNSQRIKENLLKFNKFIYGYLDAYKMRIYPKANCYYNIRIGCSYFENYEFIKMKNSLLKIVSSKNKFKDFCKFFPDIKLVIKSLSIKNHKQVVYKRIHYTATINLLSFETIIHILFKNSYEVFTNKFIPKYKLIILENMLLDFYINLSLTLGCIEYEKDIVSYILYKSFIQFCRVRKLSCVLNQSINIDKFKIFDSQNLKL